MLTNPLPHNQNMNSRTHDQSGGDQDPLEGSVRGCINMVRAAKVVTHAKDYGSSQPTQERNLIHQEPLCVLKNLWINLKLHLTFLRESLSIRGTILMLEPPNTIKLSRIWATLLVRCLHWKCFRVVLRKGRRCFLPLCER